jgi:hypothetical protein
MKPLVLVLQDLEEALRAHGVKGGLEIALDDADAVRVSNQLREEFASKASGSYTRTDKYANEDGSAGYGAIRIIPKS